MHANVIVIGAGLSGTTAAYAAARQGERVLLLDRNSIGVGTNSSMANGFFAAPQTMDLRTSYIEDTLAIGKGLNCRWMVEYVADRAVDSFSFLKALGFDWKMIGPFFVFPEKSEDTIRGAEMMRALAKGLKKQTGVSIRTGLSVLELLREGSRVSGVRALGASGEVVELYAKAVVLASGGAGAIYQHNDNSRGACGHGYRLAVRAGLELMDIEFVQFYPLLLQEPGLPQFMLYPNYPPESSIINEDGVNLLSKYNLGDLNAAIKSKRDEFSACLFSENERGQAHMDFTRVPDEAWETNPMAFLKKFKFDFRNLPVRVGPGAHFFNGGVVIGPSGQTSLEGLYACGEVVGGLHGANRRGGNALSECIVFGRLAGESAARHAQSRAADPLPRSRITDRLEPSDHTPAYATLGRMWRELQEIAWRHAGIVRSLDGLHEGSKKVKALQAELQTLSLTRINEYKLANDLESGLLVLNGILTASKGRSENRGCFRRDDIPHAQQLDPIHSILRHTDEGFSPEYGKAPDRQSQYPERV